MNVTWKICHQIRQLATDRNINLASYFEKLDPCGHGKVSDTKFHYIMHSKLGTELGINKNDTEKLAAYFKMPDGQIGYKQLCAVIQSIQDSKPSNFVTGLEWQDVGHVNVLTPFESRQFFLILTKIAQLCKLKEVNLEPYFKDYEFQSKNNGTITIEHFRRVLYFMGITLDLKDFRLILKRFLKDSYTINYLAFIEAINNTTKSLDTGNLQQENITDNVISTYGIIGLPRPDIDIREIFSIEKSSHPSLCQRKKKDKPFNFLMLRIKKHISNNSIRTRQFFERFDPLKSGLVTISQFHRGLDAIGLSGLHRLCIAEHDLQKLFNHYADATDPARVKWSEFCEEIDEVFAIKYLDKQPYKFVQCPPENIQDLVIPGTTEWECLPEKIKELAQETIFRIKKIVRNRNMMIEPFFISFDKNRQHHVTKCQMSRIFAMNSILMSTEEIAAMMCKYGDDLGFNYKQFLNDINEVSFCCERKHLEILKLINLLNKNPPLPCKNPDLSIIEVLAKIKGLVIRKRIKIDQFLSNTKKPDLWKIPESEFRRMFSAAGIFLESCELDVISKCFKSSGQSGFVDHRKFIEILKETLSIKQIEKCPSIVPHQYIPSTDDSGKLLTFDERCIVSRAIQNLSRYNDDVSNLKMFFDDYGGKSGTVDILSLRRVFKISGIIELITEKELLVLFKCFSVERGISREFIYKDFLMVLSHVNAIK